MAKGEKKKAWYRENIEHVKNYNHQRRLDFPENYLYHKAANNAQQSGKVFTITKDDIVIPSHCPVLGIPLSVDGDVDNSPSLDRFDNLLGYIKGNVNVISWRANRLKGGASLPELKKIVTWMENHGS